MIFNGKNKGIEEKEIIEIRDEEDTLPNIETIEESNVEKIAIIVITSLPHSPNNLHASPCSIDTEPKEIELELV